MAVGGRGGLGLDCLARRGAKSGQEQARAARERWACQKGAPAQRSAIKTPRRLCSRPEQRLTLLTHYSCLATSEGRLNVPANPYFHTCRYRGRHWDDCVQNVAQELRPLFDDGEQRTPHPCLTCMMRSIPASIFRCFLGPAARRPLMSLIPFRSAGVPELGVRPIDPLFVEAFNVSEASGQFRVDLRLSNVTMHGLRDYQVTGVRYVAGRQPKLPRQWRPFHSTPLAFRPNRNMLSFLAPTPTAANGVHTSALVN